MFLNWTIETFKQFFCSLKKFKTFNWYYSERTCAELSKKYLHSSSMSAVPLKNQSLKVSPYFFLKHPVYLIKNK